MSSKQRSSLGVNLGLRVLNQHKIMIQNESKEQSFFFDRVFDPSESQESVAEEVQNLVTSCLDGFNVCIMAYGQTGSGKTFTMVGDQEQPGLYFSSVSEIFHRLEEQSALMTEQRVKVSVVEIYNEQIRDLLPKLGEAVPAIVKLRDNAEGETVSNERLKTVKSQEQALLYLKKACMNRAIGVSAANEQSSRSHFIFTIHVSWRHALSKAKYSGKINLVDLAGSERLLKNYFNDNNNINNTHATSHYTSAASLAPATHNYSSGATSDYQNPHQLQQMDRARERETLNINQSLSVLGKVFLSLMNKQAKRHIPYRDSKLTHYLKDSLGGESKTMLIVQISPAAQDSAETVSTLNFGERVSHVEKGPIQVTRDHSVMTGFLSVDANSPKRRASGPRTRCKSQNKTMLANESC